MIIKNKTQDWEEKAVIFQSIEIYKPAVFSIREKERRGDELSILQTASF